MKAHTHGIIFGAALLAAGAVQFHSGVLHSQAAGPRQHAATVHIKEASGQYGFYPASLTVTAGTRVTWVNNSDAPHTVAGTRGWTYTSKMFSAHKRVSHLFNRPGTYRYVCSVHPYMKGTIVVKGR